MPWFADWFKTKKSIDLTAEEIAELEKLQPKPEGAGSGQPSVKAQTSAGESAVVAEVNQMKEQMKSLVDALGRETRAREDAVKALEEKAKTDKAKEIEGLIEAAKKDGKIEPKNEEKITLYKSILEKDFESGKKLIEALPKATTSNQSATEQATAAASTGIADTKSKIVESAKEAFKVN